MEEGTQKLMEVKNHRMLKKALQMLEYIANQPDGVSLIDICSQLSMAKSSAYVLLMTFVNMGYVKKSTNNRFIIGMKPFEIGSKFVENNDFSLYSRDVLKELVDAVDETAHLAVLDGSDVVYLSKCDCSHVVRMSSSVGKRIPAHATALGKALLSGKTDEEIREMYSGGMRKITAKTIDDVDILLQQLNETRQTGFSYEQEESTLGVQCIAVPVKEHSGSVYLGLSLSVPIIRKDFNFDLMKQPLLEAKLRLERVL